MEHGRCVGYENSVTFVLKELWKNTWRELIQQNLHFKIVIWIYAEQTLGAMFINKNSRQKAVALIQAGGRGVQDQGWGSEVYDFWIAWGESQQYLLTDVKCHEKGIRSQRKQDFLPNTLGGTSDGESYYLWRWGISVFPLWTIFLPPLSMTFIGGTLFFK